MVAAPRRGPLGRSRTTFVLLVLTSITLVTLDFRGDGGALGAVRDAAGFVLDPVRRAASVVTDPVTDAWNGATGFDEVEAENEQLRAELAGLRAREQGVADLERRVAELEQINGLTDPLDVPTVAARVVDAPVSNFERTMQIDVGRSDGVRVGMPVVAPGGLLGRLAVVGDSRSQVELLVDPAFSVGIRLARSGETGVADGAGRRAPLTVDFVDVETPVVPGESVVTSGLQGSRFPPGILVGTVLRADVDPVEARIDMDVVPSADLNRVDVVDVLRYEAPSEILPDERTGGGPR